MQIKVTNEWNAAHWATYTLTLEPQQQQEVTAYRLANPEATARDILDLLDIEYTDVTHNGTLTDEGSKVYYNEYESEIDDEPVCERCYDKIQH